MISSSGRSFIVGKRQRDDGTYETSQVVILGDSRRVVGRKRLARGEREEGDEEKEDSEDEHGGSGAER